MGDLSRAAMVRAQSLLIIFTFAANAAAGGSRVGPKCMLLDERNVHTPETDATLVLGTVTKHAEPLITEERDYEMRFDNMQPNVWFDPQMSKWRAWYSSFTSCSKPKEKIAMCNNAPQTCGSVSPTTSYNQAGRGEGFLYAESTDGITWTKPHLGLTDWKGNKENNLIELNGMTTQVYLDEKAAPSQRYKIVTGSNGAGGIAVSADGIHWKDVKDLKDTHTRWDTPKNLIWDSERKQWVIYVRSAPTVSEEEAGNLRVQSYVHSLTEDFMGNWSAAVPVGLNSSAHYQPDGLVVFPYEGIYIGIGNVFNPSQEPGPAAPIGQVNSVLAWSPDARHWNWISPTESFIPLGASGDFDACGVFGAKQDPVRTMVNNTLRYYYTGCNGPFFGSRGCALGLATFQRDGFAGYRGGTVITVPVAVAADSLTLSLDGGSRAGVRVGVVDDEDRPAEACEPIKGKHTEVVVSWKNKGSDLQKLYGAVTLQIVIPDDAIVFAFSFAQTK